MSVNPETVNRTFDAIRLIRHKKQARGFCSDVETRRVCTGERFYTQEEWAQKWRRSREIVGGHMLAVFDDTETDEAKARWQEAREFFRRIRGEEASE